jgi:hypothetical protein
LCTAAAIYPFMPSPTFAHSSHPKKINGLCAKGKHRLAPQSGHAEF